MTCAIAADTKLETPEGPMMAKNVVGKTIPVFTRESDGRIRFRMIINARKVAEQQPVLKIVLETGGSFRVAPEQVLFKKGMIECRADELRAGDDLEPAFHYPQGYEFQNDLTQTQEVSRQAWKTINVEPDGTADIYSLGVRETGCFMLSAGVLAKGETDEGVSGEK